jgi:membrane protein
MTLETRQNATGRGAKRAGVRAVWGLLVETYNEWDRDNASSLAASLAYYAAFALAPVIVIAVAVAGLVLGRAEVREEAMRQVALMAGPQAADLVRSAVEQTSRPGASLVATLVSVVAMVLSAMGVFGELQRALDVVWNVPPAPSSGLWQTLRGRAVDFAIVLGVGLLLLASVVANAALEFMSGAISRLFPATAWLFGALGYPLSMALVAALFAFLFRILPRADVKWRDAWVGAAATAVLFTAGRAALSLYFAHSALTSTYGAAGSLAVLLAWLYYSANVFFFGAEFTQVYARTFGTGAPRDASGAAGVGPGHGPGVATHVR